MAPLPATEPGAERHEGGQVRLDPEALDQPRGRGARGRLGGALGRGGCATGAMPDRRRVTPVGVGATHRMSTFRLLRSTPPPDPGRRSSFPGTSLSCIMLA